MLLDKDYNIFFDFDVFLNNLLYLWPLYIIFLRILFVTVRKILVLIRTKIANIQTKQEEKLRETVAVNSKWYRDVLELNHETKYYSEVFGSGHSVYYFDATSKAQFDRLRPVDIFPDFLVNHRESVERALKQVYRNRIIFEAYNENFHALQSYATPQLCEELGVDFEKFMEIERKVVHECKLSMISSYCISCYVRYVSPQGRKHYSKHELFDEPQVYSALKDLDEVATYHKTETYRRKQERSKLTPSLRYDIMKRDGFRCCLCGRSADNGIELEVDHIVPISKGGNTVYNNLQTLCRDCNRGKGTKE